MKKPIVPSRSKRVVSGALAIALLATAIGFLVAVWEKPGLENASTLGVPPESLSGVPCPPTYIGNYPDEVDTAWSEDVQGIAHDDDHWFITQTKVLWSFPVDFDLGTAFSIFSLPSGVMRAPMPNTLEDNGFNHYGDLDRFGDYLFVPLEGSDPLTYSPIEGIAAFKSSDLSLVSWINVDQGGHAGWLAIRQEKDGLFVYSSPGTLSKDDPLYRYQLDMTVFESTLSLTTSLVPAPSIQPGAPLGRFWLNESNQQPLLRPFKTMQGGVFDPWGYLYLINGGADEDASDQRGGIHVFNAKGRLTAESTVDAGDGGFRYEYHPGPPRREEPEGIDWWDNPPAPRISGQLHALMLDNDKLGDDVYLKHYSITDCPMTADLRVTNVCGPDDGTSTGMLPEVTCTISVDNLGPGVPRRAKVLDSLWAHVSPSEYSFHIPSAAVLVSEGTAEAFTLDCLVVEPNQQYECDLGMVPVNGRVSYSIRYRSYVTADFDHEVWVFSGLSDPDLTNNQAIDAQAISTTSDLTVFITDSIDPVVAGTSLLYRIDVLEPPTSINLGTVTKNVELSIYLSAEVEILSVSRLGMTPFLGCTVGVPGDSSSPTRCMLGSFDINTHRRVDVEVRVLPDAIGPIHVDASVVGDAIDWNLDNNFAYESTTVVTEADVEVLTLGAQSSVLAGAPITYELAVVNHGPSAAQGAELRVHLDLGVQFQQVAVASSGGCSYVESPVHELVCSFGELVPNEDSPLLVHIDVVVLSHVDDGTTIAAVAKVASTTFDPSPGNDERTVSMTVQTEADLEIQIQASCLVCAPSAPVVYTITVVNHGPSDALDVIIVDTLPLSPDTKKVRYLFDTVGCSVDSRNVLTCALGTIKAGELATFDIFIETSGGLGVITNFASVSSSTFDPVPMTNAASKTVVVTG